MMDVGFKRFTLSVRPVNFWKILQEIQEFLSRNICECRNFWFKIQEEYRKFSIFGSKYRKNIGSLVGKIQQKLRNMEIFCTFYIMQNSLIVQQLLISHVVHVYSLKSYDPEPSSILACQPTQTGSVFKFIFKFFPNI